MQLISMAATQYITAFLRLFAGLGAFLIGVKIMSDSMSKLANAGIRKMFQKIDNKRVVSMGIGAGATAIMQSSAVTTVMVVGFVNAGAISLNQAAAVIMGANIGTTVTAQLAALQGFDFMQYAIILTLAGMLFMTVSKTEKFKTIGFMIAGLGLMFLSLQFMTSSMSSMTGGEVQTFLSGITNPFLLLFVGMVLTFLLQSSAALTTMLISMAASGLIIGGNASAVGNGALFVILGSNIGTCFTTMLAAAGTTANAKRAAFIHFLFNFLGSLIFFVLLVCWPTFTDDTLAKLFPDAAGTQLAMFHTLFNTLCMLIFLPMSDLFVKLSKAVIREKKGETHEIAYIDDRFLATPSIAIAQSVKEFKSIADFTMETCDIAVKGFMTTDVEQEKVILDRLAQSAAVNAQLTRYLVNISANSADIASENDLSRLYYALGDIMRVGDLAHNITKYTRRVASGEATLSDAAYPEIENMYGKIRSFYDETIACFTEKNYALLPIVAQHEQEIDDEKRALVNRHIERLKSGECEVSGNNVFVNLVGNLERMADHLYFIAQSVTKTTEEIKFSKI